MKIETLPLSAIVPDPANVRLHDERNLDTIRGSLARFGQQKPIVVDSAGVIRAGNGTYMAAKSLGWETIDVVRTSLAGLDATAFAIADNRSSDLSTFDDLSLAKLLQELDAEGALDGVGFDEAEIKQLLADLERSLDMGTVDDPGPEDPPERPVSRLGDLWILGKHRLLCGDSTKAEDVARVMDGQKASLFATDGAALSLQMRVSTTSAVSRSPTETSRHHPAGCPIRTARVGLVDRSHVRTETRDHAPHSVENRLGWRGQSRRRPGSARTSRVNHPRRAVRGARGEWLPG